MKKIKLSDIMDIAEYEKIRPEFRKKIMAIKDKRRIHVGPVMTYLFENYDTMFYQVEEMMRAERIVNDDDIMQEINAYNELIPEKNQLSASLLIEIDDKQIRTEMLRKMIDLPAHTFMVINDKKIPAEFDPRQGSSEQLSSVQYIKFNLSESDVDEFKNENSTIELLFDHPAYNYKHILSPEEKSVLYNDLTSQDSENLKSI